MRILKEIKETGLGNDEKGGEEEEERKRKCMHLEGQIVSFGLEEC